MLPSQVDHLRLISLVITGWLPQLQASTSTDYLFLSAVSHWGQEENRTCLRVPGVQGDDVPYLLCHLNKPLRWLRGGRRFGGPWF